MTTQLRPDDDQLRDRCANLTDYDRRTIIAWFRGYDPVGLAKAIAFIDADPTPFLDA